ncbi:putative ATPase [Tanticharoenia sakaeratensis NBRC 103193]|nr:putative ATPase [Tanticharoenia sakaeratensis NBRC 103193]
MKIGVEELRGNLAAYLRQARLGSTFLIMSHNEIVAELRPPAPSYHDRRRPGALRGRIKLSTDFGPTPQDVFDSRDGDL